MQNLRIRINRLRRKNQDTDELLLELEEKEKSYGRGQQHHPPGAYLASNQIFSPTEQGLDAHNVTLCALSFALRVRARLGVRR